MTAEAYNCIKSVDRSPTTFWPHTQLFNLTKRVVSERSSMLWVATYFCFWFISMLIMLILPTAFYLINPVFVFPDWIIWIWQVAAYLLLVLVVVMIVDIGVSVSNYGD